MKKRLITIFSFFLICASLSAQPDQGMPNEPGKCYAKCLIQDEYEYYDIQVPVYIGDDSTIINTLTTDKTIIIKEESTEWVKREVPALDEDGNKHKTWCLVEKPIEYIYFDQVLIDTTKSTDYVVESVTVYELQKPGGFTDWREVVCEADIDDQLLFSIKKQLEAAGYFNDDFIPEDYNAINKVKTALTQYQIQNGLPTGQFDVVSLEALGIF